MSAFAVAIGSKADIVLGSVRSGSEPEWKLENVEMEAGKGVAYLGQSDVQIANTCRMKGEHDGT